eukprot:8365241-Pyramimonas_sp.AAC.1
MTSTQRTCAPGPVNTYLGGSILAQKNGTSPRSARYATSSTASAAHAVSSMAPRPQQAPDHRKVDDRLQQARGQRSSRR